MFKQVFTRPLGLRASTTASMLRSSLFRAQPGLSSKLAVFSVGAGFLVFLQYATTGGLLYQGATVVRNDSAVTPEESVFQSERDRRRLVYRQITTGSLLGLLAGVVFGKLSRVIFTVLGCGTILFEWLLSRGFLRGITGGSIGSVMSALGLSSSAQSSNFYSLDDQFSGKKIKQTVGVEPSLGEKVWAWTKSSLGFLTVYPAFKLSFLLTFGLSAFNI